MVAHAAPHTLQIGSRASTARRKRWCPVLPYEGVSARRCLSALAVHCRQREPVVMTVGQLEHVRAARAIRLYRSGSVRRTLTGMGLQYRRRVRVGPDSWVNVSKSGLSLSKRRGRVTVNSRGGVFVRLARGLFYRGKL